MGRAEREGPRASRFGAVPVRTDAVRLLPADVAGPEGRTGCGATGHRDVLPAATRPPSRSRTRADAGDGCARGGLGAPRQRIPRRLAMEGRVAIAPGGIAVRERV